MATSVNGMAHFPAVIDWVHVVLKGVLERINECSNEGKKSGPKVAAMMAIHMRSMGHCTRGTLRRRRECHMSELSVERDVGNRRISSSVSVSTLESYCTRCPQEWLGTL